MAAKLSARLEAASDWRSGSALPRAALLCHDGMGMAGPSRDILALAQGSGHAVLFTGHVPAGSPGDRMVRESGARWIRLPTHPTLPENLALVARTQARRVIGHSCEPAGLQALSRHLSSLDTSVRTGDSLEL
jgi:hypothetical protein